MKILIILLGFCFSAHADDLTLLMGSKHLNWDYQQDPNESNPGVIYTHYDGPTVGAYVNSFGGNSLLAGYTFRRTAYYDDVARYRLIVAVASGYDNTPLALIASGVVTIGPVSIGVIPSGIITIGYFVRL